MTCELCKNSTSKYCNNCMQKTENETQVVSFINLMNWSNVEKNKKIKKSIRRRRDNKGMPLSLYGRRVPQNK